MRTDQDEKFMRAALNEAKKALGRTSPNPAVGAVLVIARMFNAVGLSRSLGPTMPRQSGAGLTVLVVTAASLTILYRLAVAH